MIAWVPGVQGPRARRQKGNKPTLHYVTFCSIWVSDRELRKQKVWASLDYPWASQSKEQTSECETAQVNLPRHQHRVTREKNKTSVMWHNKSEGIHKSHSWAIPGK